MSIIGEAGILVYSCGIEHRKIATCKQSISTESDSYSLPKESPGIIYRCKDCFQSKISNNTIKKHGKVLEKSTAALRSDQLLLLSNVDNILLTDNNDINFTATQNIQAGINSAATPSLSIQETEEIITLKIAYQDLKNKYEAQQAKILCPRNDVEKISIGQSISRFRQSEDNVRSIAAMRLIQTRNNNTIN